MAQLTSPRLARWFWSKWSLNCPKSMSELWLWLYWVGCSRHALFQLFQGHCDFDSWCNLKDHQLIGGGFSIRDCPHVIWAAGGREGVRWHKWVEEGWRGGEGGSKSPENGWHNVWTASRTKYALSNWKNLQYPLQYPTFSTCVYQQRSKLLLCSNGDMLCCDVNCKHFLAGDGLWKNLLPKPAPKNGGFSGKKWKRAQFRLIDSQFLSPKPPTSEAALRPNFPRPVTSRAVFALTKDITH